MSLVNMQQIVKEMVTTKNQNEKENTVPSGDRITPFHAGT